MHSYFVFQKYILQDNSHEAQPEDHPSYHWLLRTRLEDFVVPVVPAGKHVCGNGESFLRSRTALEARSCGHARRSLGWGTLCMSRAYSMRPVQMPGLASTASVNGARCVGLKG